MPSRKELKEYGLDSADCAHKYGEENPIAGFIPYNYCPWCGSSIAAIHQKQKKLAEGDEDCEKGGCAD